MNILFVLLNVSGLAHLHDKNRKFQSSQMVLEHVYHRMQVVTS